MVFSSLLQDQSLTHFVALYCPSSLLMIQQKIQELKIYRSQTREIIQMWNTRKDLLNKMQQFEISASDPKRLFGSSLRLLEEERFRKSCVPQLLKMEKNITEKCREFERGACLVSVYVISSFSPLERVHGSWRALSRHFGNYYLSL